MSATTKGFDLEVFRARRQRRKERRIAVLFRALLAGRAIWQTYPNGDVTVWGAYPTQPAVCTPLWIAQTYGERLAPGISARLEDHVFPCGVAIGEDRARWLANHAEERREAFGWPVKIL